MTEKKTGVVVKGVGGLYETRVTENGVVSRISLRAKGALHREEEKLAVGDLVEITTDPDLPDSTVISRVFPRKNLLIRPPLSNVDLLIVAFAAKKPSPVLETVDKLLSIAEHLQIEPVVVVTKADLDPEAAATYEKLYTGAGFPTFLTSSKTSSGTKELLDFLEARLKNGAIAAFAGASGIGKSTLMNTLFPALSLATSDVSAKIERGKHTTRHVELFEIGEGESAGFLADTPGFSLVDFERFDFFALADLPGAFRDFAPYLGKCRWTDCSHTGESPDECAVLAALRDGKIAPSRHASYVSLYQVLKNKKGYETT